MSPRTLDMLNKSEGGAGGLGLEKLGGGGGEEGGERGKKLLLLLPSPLLKNSFFPRSLFSLHQIYKSLMSGALSKNLLKSLFCQCQLLLSKNRLRGFLHQNALHL